MNTPSSSRSTAAFPTRATILKGQPPFLVFLVSRLHIPDTNSNCQLEKYDIKDDTFIPPPGPVTLVIDGGSSILFPRTIVHEGTLILARSAFSGRLLCMGAKLADSVKAPQKVANILHARTLLEINQDPSMDGLPNQILGMDVTADEHDRIPALTDSEYESDDSDVEDDTPEHIPCLTDSENEDSDDESDLEEEAPEHIPPLTDNDDSEF